MCCPHLKYSGSSVRKALNSLLKIKTKYEEINRFPRPDGEHI